MDIAAIVNQIGLPLLAVVVPLIIAVFKAKIPWLTEKAPWALPLLAPVIGAAGDFLLGLLAGVPSTGLGGALAGLAGVGVREVVDQAKKALPS